MRHAAFEGGRAEFAAAPERAAALLAMGESPSDPDLDAVERFHREAKALLEVHHPAVVRCHDLLRDEHGCIYLVMELIDGMPLSRRTEPEITIRFLDGFRELCRAGLVLHQCAAEFSLTRQGFQVARGVDETAIAELLELGIPV